MAMFVPRAILGFGFSLIISVSGWSDSLITKSGNSDQLFFIGPHRFAMKNHVDVIAPSTLVSLWFSEDSKRGSESQFKYGIDVYPHLIYSKPFSIPGGHHTLYISRGVDNELSPMFTVAIMVDDTPPQSSAVPINGFFPPWYEIPTGGNAGASYVRGTGTIVGPKTLINIIATDSSYSEGLGVTLVETVADGNFYGETRGSTSSTLTGQVAWSSLFPNIKEGAYHIKNHAIDAAGNIGEGYGEGWPTWVVDASAPTTKLARVEGSWIIRRSLSDWSVGHSENLIIDDRQGFLALSLSLAPLPHQSKRQEGVHQQLIHLESLPLKKGIFLVDDECPPGTVINYDVRYSDDGKLFTGTEEWRGGESVDVPIRIANGSELEPHSFIKISANFSSSSPSLSPTLRAMAVDFTKKTLFANQTIRVGDEVGFMAQDTGSGVGETYVNGKLFLAPLSFSRPGPVVLTIFSKDHVGNEEAQTITTLQVVEEPKKLPR